jgi:hypothetical protein
VLLAKQKQHAMKLFVKSDGADIYTVEIKGLMRFDLALDHISIGMSFRQAALTIQHAKDRTKTAKLGGVNDLMVAQWVRVLVAVSLQQIAFILGHKSVWAFSFAGDGNTNRGQSFFDTRLHVCYKGVLVNLHFVVLPMFVHHTAVKALDALFPNWRSKLMNISSDGENTMTGRHAGFVTRMANEVANPVLRIWCPLHQIDLVLKADAEAVADGTWIEVVYSYSIFLRQQQNLITEMNVKCPKKTNRWTHLGRVLKFYKVHRHHLIEHTTEKNATKLPGDDWWVLTFALAPIVDAVNMTLVLLQSCSIVISQQAEFINNLIASLTDLFNVLLADEAYADNNICLESLQIFYGDVVALIEDQGSFAMECFNHLDTVGKEEVVKQVALYVMRVLLGLNNVKAERDINNDPLYDEAPPVMPTQLVSMRPGAFVKDVVNVFRAQLSHFWDEQMIDKIEDGHREFFRMYSSDTNLRLIISKHTVHTTFNEAWDYLPDRFGTLRRFCGGLATAFANMVAVESDFSILKWEMNKNRTNLMHLSLEGIFQCKQHHVLANLLQ